MVPSQPTLWRTCRALANRGRLKMFKVLLDQPGQTVSAMAAHLHQPLSPTSKSLRTLEARGLLTVRRQGRWVEYRPGSPSQRGPHAALVAALRTTFQQESKPIDRVFRMATAFTHPRRTEIFRTLQTGPRTLGQLRAATRISSWALLRHLKKLETRQFVSRHGTLYQATDPPDELGRELARLAAE